MYMELCTRITIPKALFTFSYTDRTVLLGSCFAENIGKKLTDNKFATDVNPFGTLYNPMSVASALKMLLRPERFATGDLFCHEGIYHSFSHHSRFSSASEAECLDTINERLTDSSAFLRKATRLIVTLGTAYVYRLKENGQIVSNCHKLPERLFDRSMLSVADITTEWHNLLLSLWEQNPGLQVLFTVSPIRHWKDGAHANQLSKSTLLLAIDRLQESYPEHIAYFPAYEIMMDELRDYRFYADDMLHPSPLAIEYIWQRFIESLLAKEAQAIYREWREIQKAINHKPFQPDGEGYKQFILQTLLKMERISDKFPSFEFSNERDMLKSKLQ